MRSAEGLEDLPLFKLDLSNNKMETIDGCADLSKLIELDLSNNNIKVLSVQIICVDNQSPKVVNYPKTVNSLK